MKTRIAKATFTLLMLAYAAIGAAQGFVIDHWTETIDLKPDATYAVAERIDVTFTEPRHGLLRDIPIAVENGKGFARQIFLRDISVTDEGGHPMTTAKSWDSGYVHLKIGDADVMLDEGTQKSYFIRYTVANGINWFQDDDWTPSAELYWNVTGNEWAAPIRSVNVTVNFPESAGGKGLRARVFTGPFGSTSSHTVSKLATNDLDPETATSVTLEPSRLSVHRGKELEPGEGLTIVLSVPETLIAKPSTLQALSYVVLPNLGFAIPLVTLVGMLMLWMFFGKDPDTGPMVVKFDPPDDLSGSACGTMIDERVDFRDISAGIISLAVKGYLRIHPKEEGLIFKTRTADLEVLRFDTGDDLSPFEQSLLFAIRLGGNLVTDLDLRTNVAPRIQELKGKLYQELVDRGYYRSSPETVRGIWIVLGIVASVLMGVVATALSPTHSPGPAIVGGIISAILAILFAKGMPKRTGFGSKTLAEIRGFQEFIRRARGKELEWMSEKHPDQALFEKYLPHAVAFGLTREWANAFSGILHEMPNWYATPYGTGFDPNFFAYDLINVSNSLGTSAMTPPRTTSSGGWGGSSGFSGGGGSSGGGFGGGGGGSW